MKDGTHMHGLQLLVNGHLYPSNVPSTSSHGNLASLSPIHGEAGVLNRYLTIYPSVGKL